MTDRLTDLTKADFYRILGDAERAGRLPERFAELQAILRPLLEHPFPPSTEYHLPCIFCREVEVHRPECPTRRKDELLAP